MHQFHGVLELAHHWVHLPPQNLPILSVSNCCWWAAVSICIGYGSAPPYLWDVPHILVGLGRAAIPPHTLCFPTGFGSCVCPLKWWYRQELCLPASRILPCYIIILFLAFGFSLLEKISLLISPLDTVFYLWIYLLDVNATINFEVSHYATLMGSWGCLPYIRK